MSELAFNINGERFDLPATASYWRVRRFKASGRGTPEVVYGDDGLPLIIAVETEIGEFRKLVHGVHRWSGIERDAMWPGFVRIMWLPRCRRKTQPRRSKAARACRHASVVRKATRSPRTASR